MKSLITKKYGKRAVITGIVLTAVSFVTLLLNIFNIYNKASQPSCSNKACSVSGNQLVNYFSISCFFIGLALLAIGVLVLIFVSQKHKK